MLQPKSIKPLCPSVLTQTKVKTSANWGILERLTPLMFPVTPGESAEIPSIVEKGWEGSSVVDKIGLITMFISFDTKPSQNHNPLEYFGGTPPPPLNASGDPLVSKLRFRKLLKEIGKGSMLLAKLSKPLFSSVLIQIKVKTSTDWGILEKSPPLMLPVTPSEKTEVTRIIEKGWEGSYVVDKID